MTSKWISLAILWLTTNYPFGNKSINLKIRSFAQALPRISPTDQNIATARLYIQKLGLAYPNPYLTVLNESVDFLQDPTLFDRNSFIGSLSRASNLTAIFSGFPEFQVRQTLERLLPQ